MSNVRHTLSVRTDDHYEPFDDRIWQAKTTVHGWYTRDSEGSYCEDTKYIKYIKMPSSTSVEFDLNKTHANDVYKSQEKMSESIDNLLKWISLHTSNNKSENARCPDADFVCYRGLLSRIMYSPYEKNDSLMICAVKLKGTIYMCQFATEQNKENLMKMQTDEMMKFTRYGYKFEQYMLSIDPEEAPDPDQPLSEFEETNCVYSRTLGCHNILYGAEIDGLPSIDALSDLSSAKLVELKTSKKPNSEYSFSRYKLLKWWAQSWLVDIDTVVVGYRDDEGIVRELESIKVADMPERAKRYWSAESCVEFLIDFLNFVKHVMREAPNNNPKAVYQFVWYPNTDFCGYKLPSNSQINFIPEWYTEWLNSAHS